MSPRARQTPLVPKLAAKVEVWMEVDPDVMSSLMKRLGYSNVTLANATNVTRQMIWLLRRGERTCSPDLAHKIAEALGVPLAAVFATKASRIELETQYDKTPAKAA